MYELLSIDEHFFVFSPFQGKAKTKKTFETALHCIA